MSSNFFSSARRLPDILMEELVVVLMRAETFEFKSLFTIVFSAMRERRISGGEEMLRLRTYEKLQALVREGGATKIEGRYKGVRKQLLVIAEQLKDRRIPKNHVAGVQPSQNSRPEIETPKENSPAPRNHRPRQKKNQGGE
jgi:hypothetical protein